jgi:NAD(P)H-flavin reductase
VADELARAELVASRSLSENVRSLRLRVITPQAFSWRPGQYVELAELERPELGFPYSIASAVDPTNPGIFELCVGNSPDTRFLEALEIGGQVVVSEPRGAFVREAERGVPALLIGSGTGIAPLRAMIQACARAQTARPERLTLLFGCRTQRDALYANEFFELERVRSEFRFVPTLSRDGASGASAVQASTSAGATSGFRSGRVQAHVATLAAELGAPEFYVCGPALMVSDVRRTLETLEIERSRIFSEGY